ncbi:MAG: outer membrane beta-barrel protein [Alphaproteobacteria bacterium]|nr:outer membrane beta-barrel protein [Alphaproteobacteria bacterium]
MKKLIATLCFTAALVAGNANASMPGDLSPYVSGKTGFAYTNIMGADLPNLYGFNFIAAVGGDWNATRFISFREELEVSYSREFGGNKSRFSPWAAMANAYIDFGDTFGGSCCCISSVRPYIGAGLGVAEINYRNNIGADFSRSAFNWGLYSGLNFDLTQNLTADLGFRYTRAEVIHRAGDFQTFSGTLGLRYRF